MNSEHEAHLARRQAQITKLLDWKYRKGQREHGGKLWEHSAAWLIQQAIEEAADTLFYLLDAIELAQPECYCKVRLPADRTQDGNERTQCGCEHGSDDACRVCREREA